ncbi:ABC transporter permease [Ramlibacter monticola]|uniref:ABC transporter permease n=1 Tax=Ramlibacter monticola TaxID=1926872 RepID=A0A936YXI7_9BURK|nr:ABC transporter permease [Ramlibacter monticola]MBL0390411.1 ABC transporter permease [Ramlibacter monticola]
MLALLATYSWQEVRHHGWRSATAVLAVMLGVALAFSVHLINASALDEFSTAARSAGGEPDLELRAAQGVLDEALYARVATDARVAWASPVLELQTLALARDGERTPLRVLGVDALVVGATAPQLVPVPGEGADRLSVLSPDTVFLNAAARQVLPPDRLRLQVGLALRELRVAGSTNAGGGPLLVMDLGAAQDLFGRGGQLTRIDVRLKAGVPRADWLRALQLPAGVQAAEPGDTGQRVSQISRAYRVNLTVLALVALFTGAFLVFSVLALSVARRAQQFALLGVLGLTARQRLRLVLTESALLGLVGSIAGIALGTGLAAAALSLLGGDLGGGYFPGVRPSLQWSGLAAAGYGALGVVAAMAGGWLPARSAARLPLAQTLKGLGTGLPRARRHWPGWLALGAAVALALLPPIGGIPLAAYVSVGLLLVGGISVLPGAVGAFYDRLAPAVAHRLLPLLAVERARRVRESAAVAVSGVVAALSLAVALTVMVASFRQSVSDWLDIVLPADLYLRTSIGAGTGDTAYLTPALVEGLAQVPGVARVATQRVRLLLLDPARPQVALLSRSIGDARRSLPLVGDPVAVPAGAVPVYVSEAMVDLYGARKGEPLPVLEGVLGGGPFVVAGVWRDYVRQTGAVMIGQADYLRLTGDRRINDAQLWLAPDASEQDVQARIRALVAREAGAPDLVDFASASQVRSISLRIFDRSFAVTYWLQAVAIAIGLFGVAASFSAQVLARRKEFGLLAHLGLTRRQVLAVVAGEGAAWTVIGALAGLGLGLAVAVVLVHVVNPQSFHWTMDLLLPWTRLLALCAAVVVAGTLTAWLAGRAAAGRDAVLAVKEDW